MGKSQAERQREMLEERHRIDATIAVIDAAKRKALAQREEYGKFLKWKVQMQHRERKQREAEERELRARIDARLKKVLEEHRERKREENERWKTFATEAAPRMRESSGQMAARLQHEAEMRAKEEERQRKKAVIQARLRATPHSAPSGKSKAAAAGMTATGYEPKVQRGGSPPPLDKPPTPGGDGAKGESKPAFKTDFANEQEYFEEFDLPDVPPPGPGQASVVVPARAGAAGLDSLTAEQAKEIQRIDKDRKRIARTDRLVTDMFEAAKSRKLYSTARVMADPPADFMIGADLMRYIPADVMGSVDQQSAPKPPASPRVDSQTFFITEGDQQQQRQQQNLLTATDDGGLDSVDPQQRHHDGTAGPSPPRRPAGGASGTGRVSRWKTYDPHAWMHQKIGADPDAPMPAPPGADRNKDEERATLQWYKECYEPITRIKKRTERHQSHSWSSVATHKLPPLPAAKFTD